MVFSMSILLSIFRQYKILILFTFFFLDHVHNEKKSFGFLLFVVSDSANFGSFSASEKKSYLKDLR